MCGIFDDLYLTPFSLEISIYHCFVLFTLVMTNPRLNHSREHAWSCGSRCWIGLHDFLMILTMAVIRKTVVGSKTVKLTGPLMIKTVNIFLSLLYNK